MCVFICANPKAQEWLSARLDLGYRNAMELCVWQPDEAQETSDDSPEAQAAGVQVARGRLPIRRDRVAGVAGVHVRRAAFRSGLAFSCGLSKQQKSANPFTEAWAFLWGWIWGGR
jgi:hypothetical protein